MPLTFDKIAAAPVCASPACATGTAALRGRLCITPKTPQSLLAVTLPSAHDRSKSPLSIPGVPRLPLRTSTTREDTTKPEAAGVSRRSPALLTPWPSAPKRRLSGS